MSLENPRYFKSLEEWRSWLSENHTEAEGIWVKIQRKSSEKPGIRYEEAVLEAVAHGWIDGQIKSHSEDEFLQRYTPRRANSIWSLSNRKRAEKLISQGRMTPAGLSKVEEAKQNGRWDKAYSTTRGAADLPKDLEKELKANKTAYSNFSSFPPSARFMYIHWVNEAKREDTRARRIHTVVVRSEQNLKPGIDLRVINP